ncbi:hypothetical protein N8823_04365 [Candidatus Pseudothioglobus singularis]|jgi:hypothetical protein|nr:hypothetical protein [Candidatus Pseudothioglobus singularis]
MLNAGKRKSLLIHASEAGIATVFSCLDFDSISKRFNIFYDLHGVAKKHFSNNIDQDIELKIPGDVPNVSIFGYDKSSIDITSNFLKKLKVGTFKIGVLDTWKGLERFWYENKELRMMPDKLLVPLPSIKKFLSDKGINSEIIQVYKHPCLENIHLKSYINIKYNLQKTVLESPYYSSRRKNLIILSEPLLVNGVFVSLLDAKTQKNYSIAELIKNRFSSYNIFLRTHPVESYNGNIEFINITSSVSLEESLEFGDEFIGLGSTVISYAALTGKKVYSLDNDLEWWTPRHSQIDSEIWDELKSLGLTETIYRKKSLANQLVNFPSIEEYI